MIVDEIKSIHNFVRSRNGANGNPARKIVFAVKNIRHFQNALRFLRESQWRSIEWHENYQREKLQKLIKFSSEKVPFYRDLMGKYRIDNGKSRPVEYLKDFPIIKEADLRSHSNLFISDRVGNDDYIYMALSRKYSDKFYLPVDAETFIGDKALIARHYENAGYRIGSPVLCFVNEIDGCRGKEFRFDRARNRYYFSSSNLKRKNLPDYCRKIKEPNAGFIFGYPGSLETFADYVLEWEIGLRFQGVITSGEILTDIVRTKIESAFHAKVYDLYHYSFPILGMGQCHYCEGYHLFSEYCILELVDFNGNQVKEKGEVGRLVATNISNRALPLIRFDTGDFGVYDGSGCDCGRGLPKIVRKIAGSHREMLITADGSYLPPGPLRAVLSQAGFSTTGYQLVQEKRHKFKLKLIRGPEYRPDSLERIKGDLQERLGESSDISIESVNLISGDGRKTRSIMREYEPE
ncbi:MAG: phenylacetate--CoA ligase family protein [Candidatus Zixiibacteriota bacterium]|nr:MAG: phenylacetate--CoA ligase family protein [candidate division Zixibacteria bacterium]